MDGAAAFRDRTEAGRQLAERLSRYAGRDDVLVLGLPRGGVPVAFEIAEALAAPLDVFLVRKLGTPGQEELAMGAIASGGIKVMNKDLLRSLRIPEEQISEVTDREMAELDRRRRAYRGDAAAPRIEGKTVILVDDGLATGASMLAAVQAVRQRAPEKVVVAVGTAPAETVADLRTEADEIVCLVTPSPFFGVGGSYADFSQTSDEEVKELLARAHRRSQAQQARRPSGG